MQAAGFEVAQEVLPRGFVFLGAFTYPEHFAVTVLVDADGDEDGDVFDFAAPGALEPQAVEVDVGVFSFYRSVAPGFDLAGDLLVEFAHCRGTYPGAPKRFGDVFDAAHGYSSVVHLDECFLHTGLSTAVAFDDCGLEGELAQLRHLQGHLARFCLQRAFVVPGPRVHPLWAVFVAFGSAELIGFRLQHRVERLLHGRAHHFAQVLLHQRLVNLDHFAHRQSGFVLRADSRVQVLVVAVHVGFFQVRVIGLPVPSQPSKNVRNIPDVIGYLSPVDFENQSN